MGIPEIVRRPGPILFLSLLLTAAALYSARHLSIRTDVVSLLPEGSAAADDYRVFLERFGGLEQVFVLIVPSAGDPAAAELPGVDTAGVGEAELAHAASLLEEVLAASPEVGHARAGLEAGDREFLSRWVAPRAPLLLGEDWRRTVRRRIEPGAIAERVARLRAALTTPGGALQTFLARSDPLGFTEELPLSLTPDAIAVDPFTGTFRSPRGRASLVLVTPARPEVDPEGGRALAAALEEAYGRIRQKVDAELEFHALGGPLYAAQDEKVLRRDLKRTLTASLLTTTALLVVAFGGWRTPLLVVAPLLVGLVWTAGAMGLLTTGLLEGGISAISIAFAAVLVGLGIDYGIHGVTRFRQACLAARPDEPEPADALRHTLRHVGPPVLTSAVTTAAGFATLGFAHLPPLRELGWLVSLGILAILAAVALVGGSAAVLAARRLRPPGAAWDLLGEAGDLLPRLASRRPKGALTVAALLTVAAVALVGRLAIDADLRTLRPSDHPAHRAEKLLTDLFDIGLDTATVVVHGRDLPAALAAASAAADTLRRELPDAAVSSPAELLARGEPVAARLEELADLPLGRAADELEREMAAGGLDPRAFERGLEALRALGRGEDPGAPPADAWPEWLRRSVRRDQDGAWVAVRLRLPPGTWPDGPPPALVERVRQVAPGAAFASAVAIGHALRSLAADDLATLGLLALALVAVTVTVSFRGRLRDGGLAGLPVLLGALWTLGLWAALGRPLDLFSLAVLPILLGVGIDDGLHVVHGARTDPDGGLRGSARASSRAITLTTLTTCAGFGSLVLSSIPGLRNGGALIATGVLACWLATLLVLPALDAFRPSRRPTS